MKLTSKRIRKIRNMIAKKKIKKYFIYDNKNLFLSFSRFNFDEKPYHTLYATSLKNAAYRFCYFNNRKLDWRYEPNGVV